MNDKIDEGSYQMDDAPEEVVVQKKPLKKNERTHRAEKKKNKALAIFGSTGVLIVLAAGSYFGYNWYTNKDNVNVPSAIKFVEYGSGITNENLCEPFVNNSLQCEVNWTTDENADRGNLLQQSIAEGEEVNPGTKVVMTYSSGPQTSEFPNLVGQSVDESEALLYEMGITVSEVKETDGDGIPSGRIVSASIDPGATVENGTEVVLNISDGATEIPDWKDKSKDFVEADAQKYGLTVNFVEEASEKAPGLVLSQTPAAGEITEDGEVTVNIAKPIEVIEVEIPDVLNMTAEDAQSHLAVAGFTNIKIVTVDSSTVDSPQVVEVIPGVNEKASTNSQIVIVIAEPEKPATTEAE